MGLAGASSAFEIPPPQNARLAREVCRLELIRIFALLTAFRAMVWMALTASFVFASFSFSALASLVAFGPLQDDLALDGRLDRLAGVEVGIALARGGGVCCC